MFYSCAWLVTSSNWTEQSIKCIIFTNNNCLKLPFSLTSWHSTFRSQFFGTPHPWLIVFPGWWLVGIIIASFPWWWLVRITTASFSWRGLIWVTVGLFSCMTLSRIAMTCFLKRRMVGVSLCMWMSDNSLQRQFAPEDSPPVFGLFALSVQTLLEP